MIDSPDNEPPAAKPARNRQLPVRPPEAYFDALAALTRKTGRTLTREVLMALDAHLERNGISAPNEVPDMGRPRRTSPEVQQPALAERPKGKRK